MIGSNETKVVTKTVEIETEVTEVTITMSLNKADILRSLLGRMGPKQVGWVINALPTLSIAGDEYSVDETMAVIYEFYNVLFDNTLILR